MTETTTKARAVHEWFEGYCKPVSAVDVDALIASGVSAEWAEDVANDVDEANRAIEELNEGLRTIVETDVNSESELEEAWGVAERTMPIMEGLLISAGPTTHDALDYYAEQDADDAYEVLQGIWNEISDRDDYFITLNEVIRSAR